MRSNVCLALSLLVGLAAAEEAASVTCAVNAYYWGTYNGKHYCVKCPDGKTSAGCTGCTKDPTGATCAVTRACAIGKFSKGAGCESCPAGKWQSQKGKSECYECAKGARLSMAFKLAPPTPAAQHSPPPAPRACTWTWTPPRATSRSRRAA